MLLVITTCQILRQQIPVQSRRPRYGTVDRRIVQQRYSDIGESQL